MESHGTAHGLEIKTVSARSAGVNHLDVLVGKDSVPKSIVSLNKAVLQHALTVGIGFGRSPNASNTSGVKVLTVEGDSSLVEYGIYAVNHKVKSLGIAQVKHSVAVWSQSRVSVGIISYQPFSLDSVGFKIGAGQRKCHSFGLEPKKGYHVMGFCGF